MKVSFKLKALIAAASLSMMGVAFADTALDTTNGSIVLNVVDTTNGTSFLFDTGLTEATWTDTSYSKDLSGNADFTAFLAGRSSGSDSLSYDMIAVTPSAGAGKVFTTADSAPAAPTNPSIAQAITAGTQYMQAINTMTAGTSSTNSAYTPAGANATAYWGTNEPTWSARLNGINDLASLGSSLNFYSIAIVGSARNNTPGSVAQFLSQWTFTQAGLLTYGSAVPLPASWSLLLCGLGLMVVIGRRGNKSERGFGGGAAA